MESTKPKVVQDLSPMVKIYEDGHVERLVGTEIVPPSLDDPVQSKDVVYSSQLNLSLRIFLPKTMKCRQKLPLLVYYHGGGFCSQSAFSFTYHNYLNMLVAETHLIAVSVDYRLAPEYPSPAAYDDSWAALKWLASHTSGDGPEEWLNLHADLEKVFLAGDSAGANIAHHMAMRNGGEELHGMSIKGIGLIHPYFWGEEAVGDEAERSEWKSKIEYLWRMTHPTMSGFDDPLINPASDKNLAKLGCKRVLVIVAEKDILRGRGWYYYDTLKKSGWDGTVEIIEIKEEEHIFHLFKPTCENALVMLKKISSFLNQAN